jgi:hypothetical protein
MFQYQVLVNRCGLKGGENMKKILRMNLVIVFALLIAISANAQHLVWADLTVDIRAYQEFVWGQGGTEGHSGAYIQISLLVTKYSSMREIKAKAQHVDSGFEITLKEDDPSCIGVGSWGFDQGFYAWIRPQGWTTGQWKFTLSYVEGWRRKTETATVVVPRFNFPTIPTGIEIAEYNGIRYLVWNSIGDPGATGKHVEYRVRHFKPSLPCIDEELVIRTGAYPYELWSGNRIAVPLPDHWNSGDQVRIENRVFDDNPPSGPLRNDRALKHIILP